MWSQVWEWPIIDSTHLSAGFIEQILCWNVNLAVVGWCRSDFALQWNHGYLIGKTYVIPIWLKHMNMNDYHLIFESSSFGRKKSIFTCVRYGNLLNRTRHPKTLRDNLTGEGKPLNFVSPMTHLNTALGRRSSCFIVLHHRHSNSISTNKGCFSYLINNNGKNKHKPWWNSVDSQWNKG